MKILAIDIGGTSIKYALFDENGNQLNTLAKKKTEKTETDNFILNTLYELIDETRADHKIDGITISTAGVVDAHKGAVVFAGPTIPGYTDTPLADKLKKAYGVPCEVENDVNCAALGEYWKGEGKKSDSLALVTLGTGVGGAIILQGQLLNGFNFSAGEVGYIPVEGEKHLQNKASTSALINMYEESTGEENISGEIIFERAKKGEDKAVEAINSIVSSLTNGLLAIIYIVAPETILVGGGIAEQKEYLEKLITADVTRNIIDKRFMPKKIKCAKLGNSAGMIGAVYHYVTKHTV